ncbi:hypothetical protein SLA2020_438730 [Shorea laevis]
MKRRGRGFRRPNPKSTTATEGWPKRPDLADWPRGHSRTSSWPSTTSSPSSPTSMSFKIALYDSNSRLQSVAGPLLSSLDARTVSVNVDLALRSLAMGSA